MADVKYVHIIVLMVFIAVSLFIPSVYWECLGRMVVMMGVMVYFIEEDGWKVRSLVLAIGRLVLSMGWLLEEFGYAEYRRYYGMRRYDSQQGFGRYESQQGFGQDQETGENWN